jgi:hypothetical protein
MGIYTLSLIYLSVVHGKQEERRFQPAKPLAVPSPAWAGEGKGFTGGKLMPQSGLHLVLPVYRSVPPLTRGGQEGLAAVKFESFA